MCIIDPCTIQLRSYSYDNTPSEVKFGSIIFNAIVLFQATFVKGVYHKRGINTLVVDPIQCSAGDPQIFDTYVSSVLLITYLNSLSNGTILAGVTCDEPFSSLAPAFPLLLSMGVDVSNVGFRGMFAFILQKGYKNKTISSKATTRADPLTMIVQISGMTNKQFTVWIKFDLIREWKHLNVYILSTLRYLVNWKLQNKINIVHSPIIFFYLMQTELL